MTVTPGARIGPYEIVSALGAGGMGEVFRARDTRLKRDVALKILPPSLAKDHDRIARFEREAEMLAALNHPNIAQIHGVVDADPSPSPGATATALVMELVEGEDLAARIARGAIPVDEALRIARQIADALEAAHERGIIHRDLKPANIKVRPDGTVKVLDFGLARSDAPGPDSAMSAVTSPAMTMQGVILGTAAYMSPEQARGKPVDRRADVWAYGAVLFEMLTGKRPFDGSDATDTIAAVLRSEPDWELLPRDVPEPVRVLIRRCLEKDPQRRPSHLSVATFILSGGAETAAGSAPPPVTTVSPSTGRRGTFALAAGVFLAGIAVAGALAWLFVSNRPRPAATPIRFAVAVETAGETWRGLTDRPFVISPDGRALVYRATAGGLPRLFIRTLDRLEPNQLVESGALVRGPFFSPDSQWVGFFDGPILKKVPVSGGPPVVIGATSGGAFGASWSDDGSIVFGGRRPGSAVGSSLMIVPASGGEPNAIAAESPATEDSDSFPLVLPRSRGVLFKRRDPKGPLSSEGRLMLLDRTTGERRELASEATGADFVNGRIVYADRQGQLHALPFDPATLTALGPATALDERVHVPAIGQAMFSAALSGAIAFLPELGGANTEIGRSLVWVDRHGREEPIAAPPRAYAVPRLSPDGTRVALDIRDEGNDIWIWSLDRGGLSRLTTAPTLDMAPVWTPDGRRIIWSSTRDNTSPTLYWQAADGTGSAEGLDGPSIAFAGSVTPDGQAVLSSGAAAAIFRTALTGEPRHERLLGPMQAVLSPEVSPDGRWLAYQSDETGLTEVYVRPYPNVDAGRWQISTQRGSRPAWSRSGRELFFLDATDRLTVASITVNGGTLVPGVPRRLHDAAYYPGFTTRGAYLRAFDVSPDGQRFLMIKGGADAAATQTALTVVANWPPR